jgi:hypothetical protein
VLVLSEYVWVQGPRAVAVPRGGEATAEARPRRRPAGVAGVKAGQQLARADEVSEQRAANAAIAISARFMTLETASQPWR